jgi:hypothetical protein
VKTFLAIAFVAGCTGGMPAQEAYRLMMREAEESGPHTRRAAHGRRRAR